MILKTRGFDVTVLPKPKKYHWIIGIDPGVWTGYAVWDYETKKLLSVIAVKIHDAMLGIQNCKLNKTDILIRVEDARKRKWFGNADQRQLRSGSGIREGVGSVKRDCKIWEDFLTDLGVDFEMVAPKSKRTKLKDEAFKKVTGWQGKTNEHGRDAAMLCYGF